jgi:hypothetical protein
MSWWIFIYLGLFGVVSVAAFRDDYRNQRPVWSVACSVVSFVIVTYLFIAFWHPLLRAPLGMVAPPAFVVSVCWFLYQAVEDIRKLPATPKLSKTQRRIAAIITAVVVPVILLPAFIVAGIAALGHR